jgi:hypothetical protein
MENDYSEQINDSADKLNKSKTLHDINEGADSLGVS